MDNKIGIVIPVYKVKNEYLRYCVSSLTNQSYKNIEIVMVDDASPDDCGLWCDEFALIDKRIKVIHHEENKGLSEARNTGVQNLNSDWVIFLDADDWLELETCEILNREINQESADIYVYSGFLDNKEKCIKCSFIYEDHKSFVTKEERERLQKRFLLDQTRIHVDNCFPVQSACCRMVAKKLFTERGLWFKPVRFAEDAVFHLESSEKANKITYLQQRFYHYRNTEGSMVNSFRPESDTEQKSYMDAVWNFASEYNKDESFRKLLYYLSFVSMQLCIWQKYFNSENTKKYSQRRKECKCFFSAEPYKSTLNNISFMKLRGNQKLKYILLRIGLYGSIVRLRGLNRRIKGETVQ